MRTAVYHTWLLKPLTTGCPLMTEEAGVGGDAARLRDSDEALMHRGRDLWLATLKWISEGPLA